MADRFNVLDQQASSGLYLPVAQVTNRRFFPQAGSAFGTGTNSALGNGTLRVAPGFIANRITASHLGGEIVAPGEAGSTLLLVVYSDAGLANFPYPGGLVASGALAGDAAAVQEIDVADFELTPGLYWFGGVVQGAPTTQPTVRTTSGPGVTGIASGSLPLAGQQFLGYSQSSITGAAPATFATYANNVIGGLPRVHLRLA